MAILTRHHDHANGALSKSNGNKIGEASPADYNVPRESRKVLLEGILHNPKVKPNLPAEAIDLSDFINFEGSSSPSIPINWRFAESISALKGLEAIFINVLLGRKYGTKPQQVVINT